MCSWLILTDLIVLNLEEINDEATGQRATNGCLVYLTGIERAGLLG
jgi:hypothetical protein